MVIVAPCLVCWSLELAMGSTPDGNLSSLFPLDLFDLCKLNIKIMAN